MIRVGHYIRDRRLALRLTQASLADAIGVTPVYISMIENGKRGLSPDCDLFDKLTCALKVTPNELEAWQYAAIAGYCPTAARMISDLKARLAAFEVASL